MGFTIRNKRTPHWGMNRRQFLAWLARAAAGGLLAACQGPAAQTGTGQPAPTAMDELTISTPTPQPTATPIVVEATLTPTETLEPTPTVTVPPTPEPTPTFTPEPTPTPEPTATVEVKPDPRPVEAKKEITATGLPERFGSDAGDLGWYFVENTLDADGLRALRDTQAVLPENEGREVVKFPMDLMALEEFNQANVDGNGQKPYIWGYKDGKGTDKNAAFVTLRKNDRYVNDEGGYPSVCDISLYASNGGTLLCDERVVNGVTSRVIKVEDGNRIFFLGIYDARTIDAGILDNLTGSRVEIGQKITRIKSLLSIDDTLLTGTKDDFLLSILVTDNPITTVLPMTFISSESVGENRKVFN